MIWILPPPLLYCEVYAFIYKMWQPAEINSTTGDTITKTSKGSFRLPCVTFLWVPFWQSASWILTGGRTRIWQMGCIRVSCLKQSGFLSLSSSIAHLSTLSAALCTISHHRALQDLRSPAVLIGGAERSASYRYAVKIKPQLFWLRSGSESLDSDRSGKLAGAAHCHSLSKIGEADWLLSKSDANFLRCQYVLINNLLKGARVWRKTNDEATQRNLVSFSLLELHFL